MSIQPIDFSTDLVAAAGLPALPTTPAPVGPTAPGEDFTSMLTSGLERLEGMQDTTDQLAVQAATGDLRDVHDYMIASTESSVATEMTVAVRNKAVEAFTEIMRMQV